MKKAHAKTNRPAARDPVRTREALLNAAFAEIHRSGFRSADVDAILRVAGVTKGALYHHFENKEALGYAVVDVVVADIMRQKWQVPLRDAENPINALIAVLKGTSLEKHDIECGCPLNNIAQEMSPLDEGFRRRTAKLFREWQGAIAKTLREGRAHGDVDQGVDPDQSSTFLIAAYEGYISLAKNSQNGADLKAGLDAMVRYLDTLRVQPTDRLQASRPPRS
ncbi:TetR family transcriptional regulator [Bradyrhizobium macuxiense]|uniref:TetR family transcriptional regulator n=1 Tax=Bradyrhizobium macuxiense TaxID=1755647 RepID=A0A560KQ75_9BRAD|nr:TetR/AcrR family transcriptional regulator [Bradyrhizobium macuxiense]TWB85307.1 TetR family transcriptional regulator [Bradyrhizobium macuxiense]